MDVHFCKQTIIDKRFVGLCYAIALNNIVLFEWNIMLIWKQHEELIDVSDSNMLSL